MINASARLLTAIGLGLALAACAPATTAGQVGRVAERDEIAAGEVPPQDHDLSIWINAFIPASHTPLTVPGGPYAGQRMVSYRGCFLGDQRSFSTDPAASHRMQTRVNIDLRTGQINSVSHTDPTTQVNCSTGAVECRVTAGPDGLSVRAPASENAPGGERRYSFTLAASKGNPCAALSVVGPIEWRIPVVVLHNPATRAITVSADVQVKAFPAYEVYARRGTRPVAPVFTRAPSPGATPQELLNPFLPAQSTSIVHVP